MADRYPPAGVVERLKRFDRRLSLRWAGDRWGVYYRKPDGRDERIGSVHHELLGDGSGLLSKLWHTDIFRQHGSAQKAADFLDRTERDAKQERDEKRKQEFTDSAREEYDQIARLTHRRINSTGVPVLKPVRPEPSFVAGPASDRFAREIV